MKKFDRNCFLQIIKKDLPIVFVCTILTIILLSCQQSENTSPEQPHKHKFAEEWSFDSMYHWHEAICDHDKISDKDSHEWNGNGLDAYCNTCNATQQDLIEREMAEYDAGIDQYLFPIHRFAKTDDNMVGAPEERVKTGTPKERFEHAGRLTDKLLKDLSDQLAKDPVAADQLKPMIDELISKDYYHSSIQNIDPVIDGYRTAVTKMFAQVESLMDQDTRAKFNGVRQVYEWDVYRESLNWHKDDDSIPANNPDEKFILLDTLKLSFDKETALTLFKNPKMSQEEMHNILSETAAANGMQTASLVNLFSTGANIYAGAAGLRDSFGAGVVTKNGRYYPDGSFEKYADAFYVDVLTNNITVELAKTRF